MATLSSDDWEETGVFFSKPEIAIECRRDVAFREGLKKYLNSSEYSDVEIKCMDKSFKAHKVLLASQSAYFQSLLSSGSNNGDIVDTLEIKEEGDLMKACLEFLYTGKTMISPSQLSEVAELAEKLKLKQLFKLCKLEELKDVVPDAGNCLTMLCTGREIEAERLVRRAKQMALKHFVKMVNDPTFSSLCAQCLEDLVTDSCVKVSAQEELLTAVSMWVHYDVNDRKQYLHNLLLKLPLNKMNSWGIQPHLMLPAFIQQPQCQTLLINAMSNGSDKTVAVSNSDVDSVAVEQYLIHIGQRDWTYKPTGSASSEVMITNLAQNTSRAFTSLPSKIGEHGDAACCVNGGNIVVSGLGRMFANEVWSYHLKARSWSRRGELLQGREGHSMSVCEGSEYVLAGRAPTSTSKLITSVESYDERNGKWKHVGELMEGKCWMSCSCVYRGNIIVFGVYEGNVSHVVQAFGVPRHSVTSHVKLPPCSPEDDSVYGIAIAGDNVIMIGKQDTYAIPIDSLFQGDSSKVSTYQYYRCPNRGGLMTVSEDSVVLFGGAPNPGNPNHFVYKSSSQNLVKGTGNGWEKDKRKWSPGKCFVWPGAYVTASLQVSKCDAFEFL